MRPASPRVRPRLILVGILACLGAASGGAAPPAKDASPLSAALVLERAFTNLYGCDTASELRIFLVDRGGDSREMRAEVARLRVGGHTRSLGRFTWPQNVRGTVVLNIEKDAGPDDHFIYLPSLDRVRRVTTAQRNDSFLGTDLTYEDFERRSVRDYEPALAAPATVGRERAYVVEARPLRHRGYARVVFQIAMSDYALLRTRYFKEGAEEPFKTVLMRRDHMRSLEGHILPTLILAEDFEKGTRTEIRSERLVVNPQIPESLFSFAALELGLRHRSILP